MANDFKNNVKNDSTILVFAEHELGRSQDLVPVDDQIYNQP